MPLPLRLAVLVAASALALAAAPSAQAQGWEWARSGGSPERDAEPGDVGRGIAVDTAGNTYVTGYFYETATFGPFTLVSAGANDAFVVKYAPDGEVLWAWRGGGSEGDFGARVVLDAQGNVYLAAYFQGTTAYGPFSFTSAGLWDVALVKLTPDGDVLWARSGGGTDTDACYQVSVDAEGNAYITGRFGYPNGAPATFGPFTLVSAGSYDAFVVKYAPDGEVLWAWRGGGPGADRGYGLGQDAAGNTYVTGRFGNTATFGSFDLTSAGLSDAFVVKLSPEGDVLWARQSGGSGHDAGRELAVNADGEVYVVGRFQETAEFGPFTLTSAGYDDAFVARYGAGGDVLWARQGGGTGSDVAFSVAVDAEGDAYVAGYYERIATFDPYILTSTGGDDVFIAEYGRDGEVRWIQRAGGVRADRGHSIAVDDAGNAYVTGYFQGAATFGAYTLTSAGGNDVFVAKYDPRPTLTVTAAPVDPPVVIGPGGGAFRFRVTVANVTAQPQTFQAWTAVTGPANREPVLRPQTVTLPPGASHTRTLTQPVPANAPPGTYTYLVRLGTFPSPLVSTSFTFEKEAADLRASSPEAVAASWSVSKWDEAAGADAGATPPGYALSPPRPNPAPAAARLSLAVAEPQRVRAEVLDGLGRRVAVLLDGEAEAGIHTLVVEGAALPAGLYVVRVTGERFTAARRLVLLR